VRASNLMTLHGIRIVFDDLVPDETAYIIKAMNDDLYGDLVAVTRRAFLPKLFVQLYEAQPMLQILSDRRLTVPA